jgi:hypothetical protein
MLGDRAYFYGRGESVTRGQRRQRELEFGTPLPPLTRTKKSTTRVAQGRQEAGKNGEVLRGSRENGPFLLPLYSVKSL